MSEEHRIHARLHVSTKIEVVAGGRLLEAELKDLSKGGARFVVAEPVGAPGDLVELALPSLGGAEIHVECEVIRSAPTDGGHAVAVRFADVAPEMREALLALIDELLATTGGGARSHPRVARRVDVRFGDLLQLRAILEDISAGGLQMTVGQPLVLHEEIDVGVPDLGGGPLLTLRARVVHQRRADAGESYRVGLEFASMRREARACLEALLHAALDEESGAG